MRHRFLLLFSITVLFAHAQNPSTLEGWAERLRLFGDKMQQEEVFLHMDNTCYYLGDTLYFKAYMRLSDGRPSPLSRLLYVELLNNDGYLVERQKVEMKQGQGYGSFCLADTLYGGYYELRAYTRWQLNWGQYEHEHTKNAEKWFFSKEAAKDYYRDYDKLYSRVFPVYDKPREPGDYAQDMTLRPMQRVSKEKERKTEAVVLFYPEGGNLVAGVPNRVAFEANDKEGRHLKGKLRIKNEELKIDSETEVQSRGRGVFVITPSIGEKVDATFEWNDGNQTFRLPKAVADGVAMQTDVEPDGIHVLLHRAGSAVQEPLGLTASCHGVQKDFINLGDKTGEVVIPLSELPTGIIQLTVFNDEGRIYADRLVFVRQPGFHSQNIVFEGIKGQYDPYERVGLDVKCQMTNIKEPKDLTTSISLAVRDNAHSDYTFDTGNILTEMLLSSQIKGFVEHPTYFFESDDEEHRTALDLLLMVQGWRRYEWHEMATPGAFTLNEPYERTEMLTGQVFPYTAEDQENLLERADRIVSVVDAANSMETPLNERVLSSELRSMEERNVVRLTEDSFKAMRGYSTLWGTPRLMNADEIELRTTVSEAKPLKGEVLLHAEFVQPGIKNGIVSGDMETFNGGHFKIEAPRFYEGCHFSLAASDTTNWKPGHPHTWVAQNEDSKGRLNYPEFYVKLNTIFPRFVKPYDFYQTAVMPNLPQMHRRQWDDAILMREVVVGARRSGRRKFDSRHPAFVIDALEALNQAIDAGLCPGYYTGARRFVNDVARTYVGDMNQDRPYELITRIDTIKMGIGIHLFSMSELLSSRLDEGRASILLNSMDMSPVIPMATKDKYDHLPNLDMVYVYTDYAPRREGDPRYEQSSQPTVTIDLRRMPNEGQRMTWRDRRMVLKGYAVCEDFYQPDYSKQIPAEATDYRRTLYWNPNLQLDAEGKAQVTFYNNSRPTQLILSAEGMTSSGAPLTGISYPEEH